MASVELRSVTTRRASWLGLTVLSGLIVAGCSTGQATATSTTSTTTTTLSTSTTTTTVASGPTLGLLAGIFAQGRGFGEVKPPEFYNGGDPTGLVTHIVWKSWGAPKATGTGIGEYVGPDQFPATGSEERTTIVAFDLGTCHGKFMYKAIEWYFPQHGQRFNPHQYEDICSGTYVPDF